MKRSDINPMPEHFEVYINLADDIDLKDALEKSLIRLVELNIEQMKELGARVYAPGKWTIAEIIQHITDTERVFAYRALCFARNDKTPLPGMDQDLYVSNSNSNKRNLDDLVNELKVVRQSTILLYEGFDDEMLLRKGISSGFEMTPLAFGFSIIGHEKHHLKIIEDKYLPLVRK